MVASAAGAISCRTPSTLMSVAVANAFLWSPGFSLLFEPPFLVEMPLASRVAAQSVVIFRSVFQRVDPVSLSRAMKNC